MATTTYFAVSRLVRLRDLNALDARAPAQHVDEGLLVRAEPFHGLVQGVRVGPRVERLVGVHRRNVL